MTSHPGSSSGNLNDLRARYDGGASNPAQSVQVPLPRAPRTDIPYAASADSIEFHPVDNDDDPFQGDDDSVIYGGPQVPDQWGEGSSQRPSYDSGPSFRSAQPRSPSDGYQPPRAPSKPSRTGFHDYDDDADKYAGSDNYLVRSKKSKPNFGWRGFVANRLGIPVPKDKYERTHDQYVSIINRSLLSPKVIGFIGGKGGVGKTTTLMAVASTIAEIRSKPVVAVSLDYNTTLAARTRSVSAPARGDVTLLEFATDHTIRTPNDMAGCMRVNRERLSVLGMGLDPVKHDVLTTEQYERALAMLMSPYELIFVDFGNIPNSDAYWAALKSLDAMVIVTSTENDSLHGARMVESMTRAAGLTELLNHTSIIINRRSPAEPKVDLKTFVSKAQSVSSREVVGVPWDDHLAESGPISLDLLSKRTRRRMLLASAAVMSSLST